MTRTPEEWAAEVSASLGTSNALNATQLKEVEAMIRQAIKQERERCAGVAGGMHRNPVIRNTASRPV